MAVAKTVENQAEVQHYRELCAASIRALGHQPGAFFQASQLHNQTLRISTPELHTPIDEEGVDRPQQRALVDAYALRFTQHDTSIHLMCQPESDVERLLFNMLEQLRLESVPDYPGMRSNLQQHFEQWIDESQANGFADSHAGILIFTLAVACWTRLNDLDVPIEIDGLIEATRHAIGVEVGAALQKLPKCKRDQEQFAQLAVAIAAGIAGMLRGEQNQVEADEQTRTTLQNLGLVLFESDAQASEQRLAADSDANRKVGSERDSQYTVFTHEFDEEIDAAILLRAEKLSQLRKELDRLVRQSGINAARCAHVFTHLLADEQLGRWNNSEEFGYLDPSRLNSLVTHWAEHKVFRRERLARQVDCHLTLLLDCSGSMKQHAKSLAVLCDQLNRILGQAGIGTEVLGFTTRSWNGGRPFKQWRSEGKPALPGRLNERRHIVFKSAAQQWRRARPGIAALLQIENYREGLDGEALEWAIQRLSGKSQQRKIIMLVSDGSPMDTSTCLANGEDYLDQHLRSVIRSLDAQAELAVCALGVGLDLSGSFRHHYYLDTSQEITNNTMIDIAGLLSKVMRIGS
ncbi:MAG: cobalt chelatase [Pseudomonadota bacterium]